jgi:hypothetical protein
LIQQATEMVKQNSRQRAEASVTDAKPDARSNEARSNSEATAANAEATASNAETTAANAETMEMIEKFPPEIATLLVVAGVAGLVLPGPFGTPLLIAGGVVLWPKTFRPIERWFSRKFPAAHREGVIQIKQFVTDLNRRFPND